MISKHQDIDKQAAIISDYNTENGRTIVITTSSQCIRRVNKIWKRKLCTQLKLLCYVLWAMRPEFFFLNASAHWF